MAEVFVGTSGFLYPHWIGDFYPADLKRENFLSFYGKHFKTVEINSSFYHIPRIKTVDNWLSQVPKNFIFTFKMSLFVTHFGKLDLKVKSFSLFFESIKSLGSKPPKHLVLIQTPASFKVNRQKLENFLSHLPAIFLYAFEFRNWSWFGEEVYQILKKHNAAIVLSDNPVRNQIAYLNNDRIKNTQRFWPHVNINTASFFYIRFHGSRRLFASSYSDKELKFYAKLIKEKLKKNLDVYAYFNNDAGGRAVENAKRLKSLVL